jgi:CubicO group peptidase (beta-lactamase class C family)
LPLAIPDASGKRIDANSYYALLVLVSTGASATAQSAGTPVSDVERLDAIAGAGVREDRSVGLVAAVVKGTDTLLLKAYGKSDVEGDVPMTVDTIIAIGSDTKQFTPAAILQLRDQGKLSLDDETTKWSPDYSCYAARWRRGVERCRGLKRTEPQSATTATRGKTTADESKASQMPAYQAHPFWIDPRLPKSSNCSVTTIRFRNFMLL